jgi:hypothetical protein
MMPEMSTKLFDRLTMLEYADFLHGYAKRRHARRRDAESYVRDQASLDDVELDYLCRLELRIVEYVHDLAQLMESYARVDTNVDRQILLEAVGDMLRQRLGHEEGASPADVRPELDDLVQDLWTALDRRREE